MEERTSLCLPPMIDHQAPQDPLCPFVRVGVKSLTCKPEGFEMREICCVGGRKGRGRKESGERESESERVRDRERMGRHNERKKRKKGERRKRTKPPTILSSKPSFRILFLDRSHRCWCGKEGFDAVSSDDSIKGTCL